MNMDICRNIFHEDFSNVIYPKSLGLPALNKEACLKHYAEFGTGYGVGHATQHSNHPLTRTLPCR